MVGFRPTQNDLQGTGSQSQILRFSPSPRHYLRHTLLVRVAGPVDVSAVDPVSGSVLDSVSGATVGATLAWIDERGSEPGSVQIQFGSSVTWTARHIIERIPTIGSRQ